MLALDVFSCRIGALDWVGFLIVFDPDSRCKRQNVQRLSCFLRLPGICADDFGGAEGSGCKLRGGFLSVLFCLLPPDLHFSTPTSTVESSDIAKLLGERALTL